MATTSAGGDGTATRRPYNSPLRQQRAAETRDRIVGAGADLAHELSSWDWSGLTFRAVAERAGVGRRTVYRHFPSEKHLHDAVMERLNQLAGVDYERVDLAGFGDVAERIFRSLQEFSVGRTTQEPDDPTFKDVDDRRRAAVRRIVVDAAPEWTAAQQETAAAALDVLWHLPSYERLVGAWGMDHARACGTIRWLVDLVVASVQDGHRPET